MALILSLLVLLASLSPLLTFSRLFQMKEWRLDRLREQLRQEGWSNTLLSKTRIYAGFGWMLFVLVALLLHVLRVTDIWEYRMISTGSTALVEQWYKGLLIILSLTGLMQFIRGKQHVPIFTRKAMLILCVTLGINLLMVYLLSAYTLWVLDTPGNPIPVQPLQWMVIFLPFVQPFIVLVAWMLLLPLDRLLKNRIFAQAKTLRAQWKNPIVIGIAGSVGKTTVKELLATVLADLHPLTTPEHVNTEMGVSQWLMREMKNEQRTTKNDGVLIIEMGAYRRGEIALLSSIIRPTIGVITALGSDHLALFGSEEAIVQANGELIEALPRDGHAFLYGDNTATRSLKNRAPCPVTLVGTQPHNDQQANAITENEHAVSFETRTRNNEITMSSISVPLHGLHNVNNILLAVAVARHLGITDDRIRELLAAHRPLRTTFHVRHEQGVCLLDDTYNISPLSLRAAIDWAGNQTQRPRILLTSGLLETGNAEDRFHEESGTFAQGKLEHVIFTSDRGRTAFAQGYGKDVERLTDVTERAVPGALLLCVGRMSPATVQRLLPHPSTNNEVTK